MTATHPSPSAHADIATRVRRNAANAVLPAVLITLVGWLVFKPVGDPSGLKQTTVTVMSWVLRVAGPLLLATAAMGRTGVLWAFLLDAILSSCVALALAATVIVLFDELLHASLAVLIFAVFAAVYVRAAWSLWSDYFVLRRAAMETPGSPVVAGPEPASPGGHPLEKTPARQPMPAENADAKRPAPGTEPPPPPADEPPPDGFLAGLAEPRPPEEEKR